MSTTDVNPIVNFGRLDPVASSRIWIHPAHPGYIAGMSDITWTLYVSEKLILDIVIRIDQMLVFNWDLAP